MKERLKHRKIISGLILIFWLFFVFAVMYIKRIRWSYTYWQYINLVPIYNFVELINEWKEEGSFCVWKVMPWIYNFMAYAVPGCVLPILIPTKRKIRYFEVCMLFSVLVNLIRFSTKYGSFDIDDIILNVCGFFVGYIAFEIFGNSRKLLSYVCSERRLHEKA